TIQRTPENALSVFYILKEHKKQKIIRLGKKKEKETDVKNLSMDGISRLVCLAKSQKPIKRKYRWFRPAYFVFTYI
ncbi:unnamed protein product, partial [Allacma fusca]